MASTSPAAPALLTRAESQRERGVTPRVVGICLALALFFGIIIPIIDIRLSNSFLGAQHLPPGAVGVLLFLLGVNPLLRRLAPRLKLGRNELLTVYISCLFSCLVPGHGGESYFVPNIIGLFYYANATNGWLQTWLGLKSWLSPALARGRYDPDVAAGWYQGIPDAQAIPWDAWLVPLAAWSVLVLAIYGMMACLSVMLRAQWGEREALAFPLLRLPLEMTEDVENAQRGAGFFHNPVLWLGFGVAVFIQMLNGLHVYFPDVPALPLSLDTAPLLSEPPWNQIGRTPLIIYPIFVGITYLLTTEVSFSLWFFYWFIKLQYIGAYYSGFQPTILPEALGGQGKIFTAYQHIGAWIGYVALVLWTGREHLRFIARRALGREKPRAGESEEALSYPAAFWGFIGTFALIIGWSHLAGMSWALALWVWLVYLVLIIGLARMVAEGGLLILEAGWQPIGVVAQFFGSGPGTAISVQNGLLPAQLAQGTFMVDMRGSLMPAFVQSFKLAHDRGIAARPLLALVAAVIVISFGVGLFQAVSMGYREGGGLSFHAFYASVGPRIPAWNTEPLLTGAQNVSLLHSLWMFVGALLTYGLMLARSRFPWLPFHPIGLLTSLTSTIHIAWLSLFVGWLCKITVLRFGGPEAYRKTTPAFLGLALGDVTMILFWLLIDAWQGRTGHSLTP